MTYLLAGFVRSIPFISFCLGMALLIYENQTASHKIAAVQKEYDPEHDFVRQNNTPMGLASNSYWVDKAHPKCNPEFLTEWDRVYGAHWRRITFLLFLIPILGFGGQLVRNFLFDVLPL
jgi:hypothetical protein